MILYHLIQCYLFYDMGQLNIVFMIQYYIVSDNTIFMYTIIQLNIYKSFAYEKGPVRKLISPFFK